MKPPRNPPSPRLTNIFSSSRSTPVIIPQSLQLSTSLFVHLIFYRDYPSLFTAVVERSTFRQLCRVAFEILVAKGIDVYIVARTIERYVTAFQQESFLPIYFPSRLTFPLVRYQPSLSALQTAQFEVQRSTSFSPRYDGCCLPTSYIKTGHQSNPCA